jgi:hypothetical protein
MMMLSTIHRNSPHLYAQDYFLERDFHEKVVFVKPDVAGFGFTQVVKLTSNTTLFGTRAKSGFLVHSVQACLNAFPTTDLPCFHPHSL